ncbi:MAG: hypothetical protein PHQ58_04945 [Rhodoferax sp.]|uniref:hypothetical protein n=1 Tax=Rhodoferax sp. TaxID=50421 RepID=UPI00260DCF62|nr:hypothetical protein [Rhodoferax sp.]MDD2879761.1 hypothetical protein [Rhodoferax sp.]
MNHKETGTFRGEEVSLSKMRFYSIGLVAENKKLSSHEVEVTPIEELPFLDGELTSKGTDYKGSAQDAMGRHYQSSVKAHVSIKAKWLRFGDSNRLTPPDVRRGEAVMIFQFGDADKYYWITLKQDSNLRKLETVVWAISATRNEADATDADHSYYFEVSSHNKLVHFHTSKADGEPFAYDIQINTKTGYVLITDDAGNFISLDSSERRLEMKNSDGSHFDMDKTHLTITTTDSITVNTNKLAINTTSTTLDGSSSVRITSPATSIN